MKIIFGLLILNIIVFIHELGHFIFAKIFGVKVLSFSIGMGPILFHKTINNTDYRISLLPLGGYCGMEGEEDFKNAIENNLSSFPKNKNSLYGIHPIKRAVIAFAGPFFNLILAIFAYTIICMTPLDQVILSNKIIIPDSSVESVARNAGLKTGDKIIQIDNKKIESFDQIYEYVSLRPKTKMLIYVERDSQTLTFEVTTSLDKTQGTGLLGVMGDINSKTIIKTKTYPFFIAIIKGTEKMFEMISKTFQRFKLLFTGVDLTNVVSGPARITSILGDTVTEGFNYGFTLGLCATLELVALISISLGIMNLLPIPILDGGIILFALIHLIFKKEISPKTQYNIQKIGLIILIILFIIGTTGDIRYFFSKWSESKWKSY